jgi:hypothetical protein
MSYYRTVLKKRQKQTTLDQFLVLKRLRPSDPEAGPSGLQTLPRRERTPESQIPDVLMEGNSPSKQYNHLPFHPPLFPSFKPKMST